jgi:hypothetical protein
MLYPWYKHLFHTKTNTFINVEICVDKYVRHGRMNVYLFNLKDPAGVELSVLGTSRFITSMDS